MNTKQIIREIKATGVLPASYFPCRAFPRALANTDPLAIMQEFWCHAHRWLDHYPQDAGTEFHANLQRVQRLITEDK